MNTLNEAAAQTAKILGCPEDKIGSVQDELSNLGHPLTKKALVYQVANAMTDLGLEVDHDKQGEAINKIW